MDECVQSTVPALIMGLLLPYLAYRYTAGHQPFWSCGLTWIAGAGSAISLFGHAFVCSAPQWTFGMNALWLGALLGALYALHVHGIENRYAGRAAEIDTPELLQLTPPAELMYWLASWIAVLCAATLRSPSVSGSHLAMFCCSVVLLAAMVLAFQLHAAKFRLTAQGLEGVSKFGMPHSIRWTEVAHVRQGAFGMALAFHARDGKTTVYVPFAVEGSSVLLERLRRTLPAHAPRATLDAPAGELILDRRERAIPDTLV